MNELLTDPSVREMFVYLVILVGLGVLSLLVLLSPLIVGVIVKALKG